jgi:MoxR-like ATPase
VHRRHHAGEYRKSIEKDRSLERRFQAVKVPPPNEADAIKIIHGIKDRYEKFHAVSYTDAAIEFAVSHSNRYIPDRFLPDKAIDLIDEAGARVKLRQTSLPEEITEVQKRIKFIVHRMDSAIANHEFEKARFYSDEERKERENLRALRDKYHLDDSAAGIVGREDIEDVVSRWTGVPVTSIKEEETQKLLRVEEELHKRVISQDKAISALARAIRRSRAGLKSPHRPIGSFLFLGPTGVGKTEMARTLANFLFGSDKALIRFDMSEFMEKHSVSKLIGSPPGYVGYEEGGQLTERVKRSPYSVVLLDEIEKAHPDVFNILLQVFEDGQLTDGLGNTVDFKNVILIMTSNIGARHLMKKQGLGFQSDREDIVNDKIEELVKQEVKKTFNPEFLNRLDEVILFQSLSDADLIQIVELLVQSLNANLAQKSITISVTEEAKKWILDKTLGDRSYGARPLRRALQRYVEDPLVGSADCRKDQRAAGVPRGLSRRQPALLSPGQRKRRRERKKRLRAFCCSATEIEGVIAGSGSLEAEIPLQHFEPDGRDAEGRIVSVLDGDRPLGRSVEVDLGSVDRQALLVDAMAVLHAVDAQQVSIRRDRLRGQGSVGCRRRGNPGHAHIHIAAEERRLCTRREDDAVHGNVSGHGEFEDRIMAFLPGLRDLRHRLILWLACGQALDREPGEAVRLERARDAKVQIAEVRFGQMKDGAAAQPLPAQSRRW